MFAARAQCHVSFSSAFQLMVSLLGSVCISLCGCVRMHTWLHIYVCQIVMSDVLVTLLFTETWSLGEPGAH